MYNICYNNVEKCRKGKNSIMKTCYLTIKSIVDGAENSFFADGKLERVDEKIKLSYCDDSALIRLTFYDGKARVDREGDYTLCLELAQGETTRGEIGINGNVGDLEICTHAIEFAHFGDGLTARLRYDILLGDDEQKMELHVQAKMKKGEV